MSQPLVSVCIPTYNGASFLEEALASVVSQTYKNVEVVISDDESSDGTWAILERFRETATIPIRLYTHKPNGIGANWNHTLVKASGVYIKFLFQDDVLEPNCIEKMVSFMELNTSYGLVASKRLFITTSDQKKIGDQWQNKYENLQSQFEKTDEIVFFDNSLFSSKYFLKEPKNKIGEPPTVLFRKAILEEVGYFDERLKQVLDYVFYYRLLKKYPIAILPEKLVKFRIHPNQATNVNRNQDIPDYEEYDAILYKEFLDLLHPWEQNRLKTKYSKVYRIQKKLKKKLRG